MDGPFFTLYKWNRSFYNLYSVKNSRLKKYKSSDKSEDYLKKMRKLEISNLRKKLKKFFKILS